MKLPIGKILAVFLVCGGLCLLFYPWLSDWLYSHSVDSDVQIYEEQAEEMEDARIRELFAEAEEYNHGLLASGIALSDPFVWREEQGKNLEYQATLSLDSSGFLCFVEIPRIQVYLPVYHGTSAEVLQRGAGHLEGSPLPIGGEGIRPVISAHTGINSAKMFSDLEELERGDLFFIHVLNETLAYRVCDIQVILPEDTGCLLSEEGRDLVTLLTCTPYGVNSHRLMVTGERTEYTPEVEKEAEESVAVDTDSQWMQAYRKALLLGIGMVAAIALAIFLVKRISRHVDPKRKGNRRENG